MLRIRGSRSLSFALSLALLGAPTFSTPARADGDIMNPDPELLGGGSQNTAPAQGSKAPQAGPAQNTSAPQQAAPAQNTSAPQQAAQPAPAQGTTNAGAPQQQGAPATSQYDTDLRETVSELQEEVYQLKDELEELKKLREQDQKKFDEAVRQQHEQLDRQGAPRNSGIGGRVGDVGSEIDGSKAPDAGSQQNTPAPAGGAKDPYANQGGANQGGANQGGASNPQSQPANAGPQQLKWWQKLLNAVLDGVGKGLQSLADRKFGRVQQNANTQANRLDQRYPNQSAQTRQQINQGIEWAWQNGRPVRVIRVDANGNPIRQNVGNVPTNNGNVNQRTAYQGSVGVRLLPRDENGYPVYNGTLGDPSPYEPN